MTINQLIQRLSESGDEHWRNAAEVRILDMKGDLIGEKLDVFDVKDNVNSVDIHISGWMDIDDLLTSWNRDVDGDEDMDGDDWDWDECDECDGCDCGECGS